MRKRVASGKGLASNSKEALASFETALSLPPFNPHPVPQFRSSSGESPGPTGCGWRLPPPLNRSTLIPLYSVWSAINKNGRIRTTWRGGKGRHKMAKKGQTNVLWLRRHLAYFRTRGVCSSSKGKETNRVRCFCFSRHLHCSATIADSSLFTQKGERCITRRE